jgi:hypothetical protein
MALGSTQPLVKMSTRNIPGDKRSGAWGWRPRQFPVPNVMKLWEPKPPGTLWATPGLLRDCIYLNIQVGNFLSITNVYFKLSMFMMILLLLQTNIIVKVIVISVPLFLFWRWIWIRKSRIMQWYRSTFLLEACLAPTSPAHRLHWHRFSTFFVFLSTLVQHSAFRPLMSVQCHAFTDPPYTE